MPDDDDDEPVDLGGLSWFITVTKKNVLKRHELFWSPYGTEPEYTIWFPTHTHIYIYT